MRARENAPSDAPVLARCVTSSCSSSPPYRTCTACWASVYSELPPSASNGSQLAQSVSKAESAEQRAGVSSISSAASSAYSRSFASAASSSAEDAASPSACSAGPRAAPALSLTPSSSAPPSPAPPPSPPSSDSLVDRRSPSPGTCRSPLVRSKRRSPIARLACTLGLVAELAQLRTSSARKIGPSLACASPQSCAAKRGLGTELSFGLVLVLAGPFTSTLMLILRGSLFDTLPWGSWRVLRGWAKPIAASTVVSSNADSARSNTGASGLALRPKLGLTAEAGVRAPCSVRRSCSAPAAPGRALPPNPPRMMSGFGEVVPGRAQLSWVGESSSIGR
mmetsp:Transcript_25968/g.65909  ORF Transcript_25968/g.65909 Transcript_25968/m.65909 type:complete len:336 (+) Transcript_25968:1715-2722(+)